MEKWTWLSLKDNESIKEIINSLVTLQFTGVHVSGSLGLIKTFSQQASESGLKTNAWYWVLINNDNETGRAHPDWFNISRAGNSSLTHPPYVGYYKWLCPNKIEVQEYLLQSLEEICAIGSLYGIHLDYIRYPDVILPAAIQPKYGLVQNSEEPQFDFCYCNTCRELFIQNSGKDPLSLKNPEQDPDWLNFRLQSLNNLVKRIADLVQARRKALSAAVFPHPEIAINLVRQDWTSWPLDAVFPMIYYNFYNKDLHWIARIIKDLKDDYQYKIPVYPGIYLPDMQSPELKKVVDLLASLNLPGFSLFDFNALQKKSYLNV